MNDEQTGMSFWGTVIFAEALLALFIIAFFLWQAVPRWQMPAEPWEIWR